MSPSTDEGEGDIFVDDRPVYHSLSQMDLLPFVRTWSPLVMEFVSSSESLLLWICIDSAIICIGVSVIASTVGVIYDFFIRRELFCR